MQRIWNADFPLNFSIAQSWHNGPGFDIGLAGRHVPGGHAHPKLQPGHNGRPVPQSERRARFHGLVQQFVPFLFSPVKIALGPAGRRAGQPAAARAAARGQAHAHAVGGGDVTFTVVVHARGSVERVRGQETAGQTGWVGNRSRDLWATDTRTRRTFTWKKFEIFVNFGRFYKIDKIDKIDKIGPRLTKIDKI